MDFDLVAGDSPILLLVWRARLDCRHLELRRGERRFFSLCSDREPFLLA
jgi:hypothetical protein